METKIENKQSNSLMRKTKSELVEIILRKDEVERNLRADIKGTIEEYKRVQTNFQHISNLYNNLKYNYENICDEKALIKCKLNNKIKSISKFSKGLFIGIIIMAAINIILFVI